MSLYTQVLDEARPFLAGATESIVSRQCEAHLNIEPQALTKEQLDDLAKWVGISAALIIPKDKAQMLSQKVAELGV